MKSLRKNRIQKNRDNDTRQLKSLFSKWNYIWAIFAPIITIIFLFLEFQPRINLIPEYKISKPFELLFEIENESNCSITNMKAYCQIITFNISDTTIFYFPDELKNNIHSEDAHKSTSLVSTFNITSLIESNKSAKIHFRLKEFFNEKNNLDLQSIDKISVFVHVEYEYSIPYIYGNYLSQKHKYICEIHNNGKMYYYNK